MPRKQTNEVTLKNVRSGYILDKIFDNLNLHRTLEIIKYTNSKIN